MTSRAILFNSPFGRALCDALGVPMDRCSGFELRVRVNEPMRITLELYATPEQIEAMAAVLEKYPDQARELMRTAALMPHAAAPAAKGGAR